MPTIVNAKGPATRLSGGIMDEEVAAAATEISAELLRQGEAERAYVLLKEALASGRREESLEVQTEELAIEQMLDAALAIDYPAFEVLVVDDNRTNRLILEELLVEVTEMRVKGETGAELTEKEALLTAVENMQESNPMMGLRGIRLGITMPGITRKRHTP